MASIRHLLMRWILSGGLVLTTALTSTTFGSSPSEVKTGDGLAMTLSETGQITGLSAAGEELLSPGKVGGFLLGEYRLNPGPELVENGGFEKAGGFQMSGGWQRDTSIARSGNASLGLDVPEEGELLIHVPLKPDAVYMVTLYIKSADLDGQPILHIRRLDEQGNYILRQANINHLGVYHPNWVRLQHTFQTLPGTVQGELMFHVVYGELQGKIWIDDLSIRELPQPKPNPVQGKIIPQQEGA